MSSEDDLAQRVAYLESYTNTLHMVLDHFVQRVRRIEAAIGQDEEGLQHSLEWRGRIEAALTELMLDHNWRWQEVTDPTERSVGDVAYKQILKLSEMLPIDVMKQLWAKVEIPADLPLVWSDISPTIDQAPDPFKDQTDAKLMKHLKETKKYDL